MSNKGINYSVIDAVKNCEKGLKKAGRGLLPASSSLQRTAKRLEEKAAQYLEAKHDDSKGIWWLDPSTAVSWFLVHCKYHEVQADSDSPVLVGITGETCRLTPRT